MQIGVCAARGGKVTRHLFASASKEQHMDHQEAIELGRLARETLECSDISDALRSLAESVLSSVLRRASPNSDACPVAGEVSTNRDVRLLTCREVDRLYRKRKGTAAALYSAKQLPGRREGRAILVSAKRAEELLGVGG
jgi:hypothetical protein